MDILAAALMAIAVGLFFWPTIHSRLYAGQWNYSWQVGRQGEAGLSRLLSSLGAAEMDRLSRQAGRPRNITGQNFLILQWFMAGLFAVLLSMMGGFFFGVMGVAFGWFASRFWLKAQAENRIKQIDMELPTFLDLWSLLVASGESLESALVEIVRHHPEMLVCVEMRLVLDRVAASGLIGESLVSGARETGSIELLGVAEQVRQLLDGGGSPSRELVRIAQRIREERMTQMSQQAGAAAVIGILPKLFGVFLSLTPVIASIILTVMEQL